MTPTRAIKSTCEKCKKIRGVSSKCVSRVCKLRNGSLPHLERIKTHCRNYCIPMAEVEECVFKNCHLYPYRMGKKPKRKTIANTLHKDRFNFF